MQLGKLFSPQSFAFVDDLDAEGLLAGVVGCLDVDGHVGREFESILSQVDEHLLEPHLVACQPLRQA